MLLRGVNGPCIASGPYSCRCTDARRMFRCLSGGSSGAPFDHVSISSRSGQLCSDGYSDAFSLNRRTFRCFRVGGPARPVSLNSSAGPACQSHALSFVFLANRRSTARMPLSLRPCSPLQAAAAATPLRRRPRAPPHCSCATPALLLRSRSRTHAAPVPHTRRRSPPPTASPHARSLSCSNLPPTLVHSRSI